MTSAAAAISAIVAATSRVIGKMEQQARVGNDGADENEGGNNVLSTVVPVGYSEQVNTGQIMGESSRRTVVARSDRRESFTKKKGKKITPKSQNFKRGHYVTSHSQRQNNDRRNDNHRGQDSKEQTGTQSEDLKCLRCKNYHPNRPCRAGLSVCYQCGKLGHISRDCSHRRSQDTVKFDSQTRGNGKLVADFLTALHDISI
ncbi:hypothetical protein Ahy_B02g059420 isoform B [Arachis hypogaea]|nr:hypothetical protein Ahy_B02g059420 isoform B [Arachis hypogaea]